MTRPARSPRQAVRPLSSRHVWKLSHAGAATDIRHPQADAEHPRSRAAGNRARRDRRADAAGGVFQPRPQHGYFRKLRALAPIGVVCRRFARSVLRVPSLSRVDGRGRAGAARQYPRCSSGPARSTSSTCVTWSVTRRMARLPSLQIKRCPACPSRNIGKEQEIHQPLYEAAHVGTSAPATAGYSVRRWPLWRRAPL